MADELVQDWERFRLTEEESSIIGEPSHDEEVGASNNRIELALVGRLCTVKPFNIAAMKRTLSNVWGLDDNVAIKMIETNLFVFQFVNEEDKNRILGGMPWFFDGKLLLLKEIIGDEQPSEIVFDRAPMWVRIMDVPFNKRNLSVMREVGDSLGGFVKIDDADPLGWGEFIRIKVLVEVHKPLRRGVFLAGGNGKAKWVDIKYERLSDFCFYCGILDHTDKECTKKEEEDDSSTEVVYQYGPWLRASPLKISRSMQSDREKERRLVEKLGSKKGGGSISYNNPSTIKLGPVSAARKLNFLSSPLSERDVSPKPREIRLALVADDQTNKLVLRPRRVEEGVRSGESGKVGDDQASKLMEGENVSLPKNINVGKEGRETSKRSVMERSSDEKMEGEENSGKRVKLSDSILSGDGLYQVEGLGDAQALEKQ
ncbi:uncharacterized protein LOC110715641 [Chenopodium quinoa]|uniref:uncharacterized protein LOC110715641 n=1 Tax=Chenopodium quinoa TaxID=63459 RepID=UPI000B77D4EA|nr:uncharacterized protein LOC110715641 [Chenopodium quinoa]